MKSVSGPGEVRTETIEDDLRSARLEIIWMVGNVAELDVTKDITMFSPKASALLFTTRSGLMAPSNTNSEALFTVPLCTSVAALGRISYQRWIDPAPPATACWVHTRSLPPWIGSTAATA